MWSLERPQGSPAEVSCCGLITQYAPSKNFVFEGATVLCQRTLPAAAADGSSPKTPEERTDAEPGQSREIAPGSRAGDNILSDDYKGTVLLQGGRGEEALSPKMPLGREHVPDGIVRGGQSRGNAPGANSRGKVPPVIGESNTLLQGWQGTPCSASRQKSREN